MELYLIRHGHCYDAGAETYDPIKKRPDPDLTPLGEKQIFLLARRCRDLHLDQIVSSDLIRAVRTAEAIGKATGVPVRFDAAFREIDMGSMSLIRDSDYYHKWAEHRTDMPYPDGENGKKVWTRCKGALKPLLDRNMEKIAIVAHGGVIRSMICGLMGIPQQKRFYLGFPLENCSVTVMKRNDEDGRFYLHVFNDYGHLQALQ